MIAAEVMATIDREDRAVASLSYKTADIQVIQVPKNQAAQS